MSAVADKLREARALTANEREALRAWFETCSDFGCLSFRAIAQRSNLPAYLVRRTVRAMARKGVTEYHRCLWSDDGEPRGAGYGLTSIGRELMHEAKEAEWQTLARASQESAK